MNFAAKLKFCTPECMNILTFTWLWPNQQQLLHGLFVRERVNALAHLCAVASDGSECLVSAGQMVWTTLLWAYPDAAL